MSQDEAARAMARDFLNAISEGMDIATTVDQPAQKAAALGGALDRTIEKYGVDSGQVAALAVVIAEAEVTQLSDMDFAALEQRVALQLYGHAEGRIMDIDEGLRLHVTGGLDVWGKARAIFSMVSGSAVQGLADYFEEHGILPVWEGEKPWSSEMLMAAIMTRAEDTDDPMIRAAQCGTLAFLALVRHAEELVAQDTLPPVNDLASGGHQDTANLHAQPTTADGIPLPTGRNDSEPASQLADFNVQGTVTGRFPSDIPLANEPKEDAPTAYCFKCKAQQEVKDPEVVTADKGGRKLTGTCGTCGTKVFKQLPKN